MRATLPDVLVSRFQREHIPEGVLLHFEVPGARFAPRTERQGASTQQQRLPRREGV